MKLRTRIAAVLHKWSATQLSKTGWFVEWITGGSKTVSGLAISNDGALRIAAVFACVNAISEDVGKVPLIVYQRVSPQGKERQPDHSLYRILHDQPNPEQTAMDFRQALTANALLWGNGYAEIERNTHGEVIALWPLRPDKTRPYRNTENKKIYYEVRTDLGDKVDIQAKDVFHIHGLGYDGLVGYNVVQYARECFGLASAAEKFGASFFGNGAQPSGTLEHPGTLKKEAQERLIESIDKRHKGVNKAHRLMVLEEGMKFNPWTIPPEESQFLETREFSIPEICRWFRMKPHKIADLSRSTFNNIEHQAIEYVGDTLTSWFTRWEQAIWTKLLTPDEQKDGYFARHLAEGLLRGDIKQRYGAYAVGRQWGWLSADDVRGLEDMNPLPDEQGQKYLVPLNMSDAAVSSEEEPEKKTETKMFSTMIDDVAERLSNAEIREIEKHISKAVVGRKRFITWIENYYDKFSVYATKALTPLAQMFWQETGEAFSIDNVITLITESGQNAFILNFEPETSLENWRENRKNDIAEFIKGEMDNATLSEVQQCN